MSSRWWCRESWTCLDKYAELQLKADKTSRIWHGRWIYNPMKTKQRVVRRHQGMVPDWCALSKHSGESRTEWWQFVKRVVDTNGHWAHGWMDGCTVWGSGSGTQRTLYMMMMMMMIYICKQMSTAPPCCCNTLMSRTARTPEWCYQLDASLL